MNQNDQENKEQTFTEKSTKVGAKVGEVFGNVATKVAKTTGDVAKGAAAFASNTIDKLKTKSTTEAEPCCDAEVHVVEVEEE